MNTQIQQQRSYDGDEHRNHKLGCWGESAARGAIAGRGRRGGFGRGRGVERALQVDLGDRERCVTGSTVCEEHNMEDATHPAVQVGSSTSGGRA